VPEFAFACAGAYPDSDAAAPTISLQLHIEETTGITVHALALRTQVRIEPLRRRYDDTEAAAMADLFGERSRWGTTLKPLQLGFVNQMVPTFTGRIDVEVALPCSYDFEVAANKYLYALDEGEVPLLLLFSGTIFTAEGSGFSVSLVPWDREARFRLPVRVWQDTMELHFPGSAWLRLGRPAFNALYRYRTEQQLTSWDDAVERLLKAAEE
jgi:Family of unknown function (DUF6084)